MVYRGQERKMSQEEIEGETVSWDALFERERALEAIRTEAWGVLKTISRKHLLEVDKSLLRMLIDKLKDRSFRKRDLAMLYQLRGIAKKRRVKISSIGATFAKRTIAYQG